MAVQKTIREKVVSAKKSRHSNQAKPAQILAWEDDPDSTRAKPLLRDAPDLTAKRFHISISGKEPLPSVYKLGSSGFRYWTAAEALRRGADFWETVLPAKTNWQPGKDLKATLDHGTDLNAYYDRKGLWFFHAQISGQTVYSGESPDVLCHELGHAVLDSIRSELWDLLSGEVASFHESFGDVSAILSALQLKSVRIAVLKETGTKLYRSCRVSRLAEQLGWAIRQGHPDAVEPDCLRNAVNSFFYQSPESLPDYAPASQLSAEPHSFSRVFTGAFFEALSGMVAAQKVNSAEQNLESASQDMAKILIKAIRSAPAVTEYFSQIAAHMIEADKSLFDEKYGDALKSAFVRRGILSLKSAVKLNAELSKAKGTRSVAMKPSVMELPAQEYGLKRGRLVVMIPAETRRLDVAPSTLNIGFPVPVSAAVAARSYVEYLFRRGRVAIDHQGAAGAGLQHPHVRKTHRIVEADGDLKLERLCFDCGLWD